jgi:hypothetical protein
MTLQTPEQLAEIKERAEKATPGPWIWSFQIEPDIPSYPLYEDSDGLLSASKQITVLDASAGEMSGFIDIREEDREFICCARQDIPALLEHIEELEKQVQLQKNLTAYYRQERDNLYMQDGGPLE